MTKENIEDLARIFLRKQIESSAEVEAKTFVANKKLLIKLADHLAEKPWFRWLHQKPDEINKEMVEIADREIKQNEIDALASICGDVNLTHAALFLSERASEKVLSSLRDNFGGNGDLQTSSLIESTRERRFKK